MIIITITGSFEHTLLLQMKKKVQ